MRGCKLRYFFMLFTVFFFANNTIWAEEKKDEVLDELDENPAHLIWPIAVIQACAQKYPEQGVIAKTKAIPAGFVPEKLISCTKKHMQLDVRQCRGMVDAFSDSDEEYTEPDDEELKKTMRAFNATIVPCMPLMKNEHG